MPSGNQRRHGRIMDYIDVEISGKELIDKLEGLAKKFCKKGKWEGQYGNGIMNTDDFPYKTELVGVFGEYAFSVITGIPMDEEERPYGNTTDFHIPLKNGKKLTIDAKCCSTKEFFIQAKKKGKIKKLTSQIFVFGRIIYPKNFRHYSKPFDANISDEFDKITVRLYGYIKKTDCIVNRMGPTYYDNKNPDEANYYFEEDDPIIKDIHKLLKFIEENIDKEKLCLGIPAANPS